MLTIDIEKVLSWILPVLTAVFIASMSYKGHREDIKRQLDVDAFQDILAQYNRVVGERDRALARRDTEEARADKAEDKVRHAEDVISILSKTYGADVVAKAEESLQKSKEEAT